MPSNTGHLYISCDMEGITGVVSWRQCGLTTGTENLDYERSRRMMTDDVNAAIQGAKEAGIERVVVNDGHGTKRNLIAEDIDPMAEVLLGTPKPLSQMQGISGEFDLAFFIGFHARMGSLGVLAHTISEAVANVWIDERLVGEIGINATLAGHFGVPIGLISGDQYACAEATEFLGDISTAQTKRAVTRYSALCLHTERTKALIKTAAREAVRDCARFRPLNVGKEVEFQVQFTDTGMAEAACRIPGARGVNPTTVAFAPADPVSAFVAMRAGIDLAIQATNL